MKIPAAAVMATVLISTANSASAVPPAPAPGQVRTVIYGSGMSSCGTWLHDRQNVVSHAYEIQWVFGFVTAASNVFASLDKSMRETDGHAMESWVDKYCRENPLKTIADASVALTAELSKPE